MDLKLPDGTGVRAACGNNGFLSSESTRRNGVLDGPARHHDVHGNPPPSGSLAEYEAAQRLDPKAEEAVGKVRTAGEKVVGQSNSLERDWRPRSRTSPAIRPRC